MTKVGGSQRVRGLLLPRSPKRLTFAGSLALGSETAWPNYGSDPERNVAGVFERIGPVRYRLLLPEPQWEAKLEVLELVRR